MSHDKVLRSLKFAYQLGYDYANFDFPENTPILSEFAEEKSMSVYLKSIKSKYNKKSEECNIISDFYNTEEKKKLLGKYPFLLPDSSKYGLTVSDFTEWIDISITVGFLIGLSNEKLIEEQKNRMHSYMSQFRSLLDRKKSTLLSTENYEQLREVGSFIDTLVEKIDKSL